MSDLPPGEYSELLVGQHWPSSTSMTTVRDAMAHRGTTATRFSDLSEQLRLIQSGPIANQSGITADEIREVFNRGERDARAVAANNQTKHAAYLAAHGSAESLRKTLGTIAQEGNSKIEEIQASKGSLSEKITKITDLVLTSQSQASIEAANCAAEILDATQNIFTKQGLDHSAREFAKHHGNDIASMFTSPDPSAVREKVTALLNPPDAPQGPTSTPARHIQGAAEEVATPLPSPLPRSDNSSRHLENFNQEANISLTPVPPAKHILRHGEEYGPSPVAAVNPVTPRPAPTPTPHASPSPSPIASSPVPTTAANPAAGPTPHASPGAVPVSNAAATSPVALTQNFEHGLHVGAEVAPAPAPPSTPTIAETHPTISTTPTPSPPPPVIAHPPAVEAPTAVGAIHPPSDIAATYPAAPLAQAAPPVAPAAMAAPGPLPGYGADLRAPTPAAPAGPTGSSTPPAAASPSSTAATAQSLSQPAVVRRSAVPAATLVEQAVTATSGGAAAGALSAEATARGRLRRLLAFVARQQPRLRWAAGDRDDGSTVVVTDLASGWIPPHITVPTVLRLLSPARRRGSVMDLLGPVTVAVQVAPGDPLPAVDRGDPPPAARVARCETAAVDLGWDLIQATQWRDGLPRLAHTLVKATCGRTGVLDSEIALLREYLSAIGTRVLAGYPDAVDTTALSNWQLLAAIESFVTADPGVATYHLGWFTALTAQATPRSC